MLVALLAGCESKGATIPDTSGTTAAASTIEPPPTRAASRVEVTSAGFQPPRVDIDEGQSLVFRRTTDSTCATSVVFPSLGIEKPLPLNTDVSIALPRGAKGELTFQCGMGMDRGKVIVR